jgi:hypothetical protein
LVDRGVQGRYWPFDLNIVLETDDGVDEHVPRMQIKSPLTKKEVTAQTTAFS